MRGSFLEIQVAKLYLVLLPFRIITPFEFLKAIMGPLANYVDTIFLALGLLLWLNSQIRMPINAINQPLFKTIRNSVLLLNLSSVIMAFVMYDLYGNCNGKSPFIGIIPMILFYFQYLMMFLYNIRVFQILDYRTIVRMISKACTALLVLGYVQVLVLRGLGVGIYDLLANVIGGFEPSSDFYKLPLTASEGAGAGGLIGIFVIPFLIARYLHGHKKSLVQIILWLIPLYYTHSSTAYFLFLFDFCIFLILLLRQSKKTGGYAKIMTTGIFVTIFVSTALYTVGEAGFADELTYVAFDKVSDLENGSTVSRMTPFFINSGCFKEMPIAGVGNGLQGYFYAKYFPYEFLSVPGTDLANFLEKVQSPGTIANGGIFLPGYISGYGIIGILILINFIIKLRKTFKARESHLGVFREMFILGSWAFLIMSFSSEMYCLYYAWFVLSIPFMYFDFNGGNERRLVV